MSHEAYMWALRQQVPSTERFVLSILAERANHEGVSWPGYNNLVSLTGFAKRTVQRAVTALEERGLLEVHARAAETGRQTSNLYVLRMDRGVTLAEIVSREQRWRAERSGQLALIPAEEVPAGEGDTVTPSHERQAPAVDNPVGKSPDLSTGVTEDHPQGVTGSPSEGVTGSPLEPHINQDPVDTPVVESTPVAVDNECRAPERADTDSPPAPDGAAGLQGEGLGLEQGAEAGRRYRVVDEAFTAHFGDIWTKRQRRPGRRDAWLDMLTKVDDARLRIAITASTAPGNLEPPSAYKFLIHTFPSSGGAQRPAWPPESRTTGRMALEHIRRLQGRDLPPTEDTHDGQT